ncbi:hypothetical protein [Streptomyces sp. NPDC020965]|uniref:hypothetical protein n=1 Tax=Streptomyces sp. NPDC020965 TaxID=3365105 RepID=UPI0037A1CE56
MLPCTSVIELPYLDMLIELFIAGEDTEGVSPDHTYTPCEIEDGHIGEHANQVGNGESGRASLWVLWTEAVFRFELLPWCEAPSPDRTDVCVLYAGHRLGHSWAVRDPLRDLLEDAARDDMTEQDRE